MTKQPGSSLFVIAALVAAGVLGAVPSSGQEGSNLGRFEWYGPDSLGEGYHVRVPVTVQNRHEFTVEGPLVTLDLDLADLLPEAGWITRTIDGEAVLQAFHLDPQSIRVIRMADLQDPQPATVHGLMLANDPEVPDDFPDRRYEVPYLLWQGDLSQESAVAPFDPQNPRLTLIWKVPERMKPGEINHYAVYLDTLHNGQKNPFDFTQRAGGHALSSLFGPGPGLELYGYFAQRDHANAVRVAGLHDDTTVTVQVQPQGGGEYVTATPPAGFQNPFQVDRDQVRNFLVSTGTAVAFRVLADKPVLAQSTSEGYIPSLQGGFLGTDFVFSLMMPSDVSQDTVYFVNPEGTPSVIEVRTVEGDFVKEVHLSDDVNLLPYSRGVRAKATFDGTTPGGGDGIGASPTPPSCDPTGEDSSDAPLLNPGETYRVRVASGDPVMLQFQPVLGLSQIPSVNGAASGNRFFSAMGWTDANVWGATCEIISYSAEWFAATMRETASVTVKNLEDTVQVDPPGSRTNPSPGGRSIEAGPPTIFGPFPAPVRDRPLLFESSGTSPITLWTGYHPPAVVERGNRVEETDPTPRTHGPLLGQDGGMRFMGIGPQIINALYPDTVVRVETTTAGETTTTQTLRMHPDSPFHLTDPAGDRIYSVQIEANKPLAVYPTSHTGGFLAGIPLTLSAIPHTPQYRGHLLALRSPGGEVPITGSGLPGEARAFPLEVVNAGRQIDGSPLSDVAEISIRDLPEGWNAEAEEVVVSLAGGESKAFNVMITPAPDARPNEFASVTVRAESRGNPGMSDEIEILVFVKSSFDVGIWFLEENGAKSMTRNLARGGEYSYPVVVKNQGSVNDLILLDARSSHSGWDTRLTQSGEPVTSLNLARGESASLDLTVKPPPDMGNGLLVTHVTASSGSSPAELDRITATTKVRAPAQIEMGIVDDLLPLEPGEEGIFDLILRNTGEGGTEVELTHGGTWPAGWEDTQLFTEDPFTTTRINVSRISLGPGDTVPLKLAIRAAPQALAGDYASLRVGVTSASGTHADSFAEAYVLRIPNLEADAETPPLPGDADGTPVPIRVNVTNLANFRERVHLIATSIPLDWHFHESAFFDLDPAESRVVEMPITPSPSSLPGVYPIGVQVVGESGQTVDLTVPIEIRAVGSGELGDLPRLHKTRPGSVASVTVPIENAGNTPLFASLEADDASAWALAETPAPLRIRPHSDGWVRVTWDVPEDEVDGVLQARANLVLTPEDPNAGILRKSIEAAFEVGRPDLTIGSVRVGTGPIGHIVHASIANEGTRSAELVQVELTGPEGLLDEVEIADIRPGQTRNVTLSAPLSTAGDLVIRLDPDARIPEQVETNNVRALDTDASDQSIPNAPTAWIAGILLAAAWSRIGSDRRTPRRSKKG